MTTTLWERFHQLVEVGLRWAGQTPAWQVQDDTYLPPTSVSSGVALEGAAKTLVHITPRAEAHRRTFWLMIPVFDPAAEFVVTIEGIAVSTPAVAKADDTLTAIAAALNAHPTINQIVEASAYDPETGAVLVQGLTPDDFELTVSSTLGEFVAAPDATSCKARVWLLADVPAAYYGGGSRWVVANQSEFETGSGGVVERIDTAGFSRIYVEIVEQDGLVRVAVGPGVLE